MDQLLIPVLAYDGSQPQTGAHPDGHCQPQDHALDLDPDFIRLDVSQIAGPFDQLRVDLLAMDPGAGLPGTDRALVQAKGHDNGRYWTAESEQGHHLADHIDLMTQSVKGGAVCRREGMTTNFALVTCICVTMDYDVVLAYLTPCGTGQIRTKLSVGIHWLPLKWFRNL
jgi:hypothetical protein